MLEARSIALLSSLSCSLGLQPGMAGKQCDQMWAYLRSRMRASEQVFWSHLLPASQLWALLGRTNWSWKKETIRLNRLSSKESAFLSSSLTSFLAPGPSSPLKGWYIIWLYLRAGVEIISLTWPQYRKIKVLPVQRRIARFCEVQWNLPIPPPKYVSNHCSDLPCFFALPWVIFRWVVLRNSARCTSNFCHPACHPSPVK